MHKMKTTDLAYMCAVHGSIMLGNLNVRSPRAMTALERTIALVDFSRIVNSNGRCFSQNSELHSHTSTKCTANK